MSYSVLSRHYDRLMGDFPYEAYVDYVAPKAHTKGLDLACGTGRATCLLAARGVAMHGVDASQEMLNVAVVRARSEGLDVSFGLEDLRRFSVARYDLVTCVCDGLNYVPTKDLSAVFGRVAACLSAGGKMVFDVSTPYKLREVLGNNIYYEDYDDLTYYWQNKWVERTQTVRLELTFFEKEGEVYRRYDESQTQYAHSREAIETAVRQSGMTVAEVVDGDSFSRPRATSRRLVYTIER